MSTLPFCISDAGCPAPSAEEPAFEALLQEVEKEFSTLVIRARMAIRKRATSIHPELQPMGYKVLSLLVRHQAHHQVVLAEKLEVDKATMSRTIKQLEGQGLIIRTPDPADGRAMLVNITDAARAKFIASGAGSRTLLRDRISTWEPAEIKRFSDLLARLNVSEVFSHET